MRLPAMCDSCKHLRVGGKTCVAFPEQIPDEIRKWGEPHTKPRLNQVGDTVWEMGKAAEEQKAAWDAFQQA